MKIVVLERREQCIEALESYYAAEANSVESGHKVAILRARIMAFWYQIEAMVRRRTKEEEEFERIRSAMLSAKKSEDLVEAFEWMNKFVDDLGLTFIDSRERYDRRRVEDANQKKGL